MAAIAAGALVDEGAGDRSARDPRRRACRCRDRTVVRYDGVHIACRLSTVAEVARELSVVPHTVDPDHENVPST
jgi:hypothetical protein